MRATTAPHRSTDRGRSRASSCETARWLIAWGYFQKIFVADNLARSSRRRSSIQRLAQTGINILLGVYAFAFQIYGDFAGYSNIARGTSKLMGIELIDELPFSRTWSGSPQAFWRNWHISLSTWLRDYLYIPLGGSRGSEWNTRRNLFITMVLGGLWHGAAWTFVVWGVYQGALLICTGLLNGGRPSGSS